jgi:hypothetical protein
MDRMDYPQEEKREIPKDLIPQLLQKYRKIFKRNLLKAITLSLPYLLTTLISLYLLRFLQKTAFGYSPFFTLLLFLYPLLPFFLFRHYELSIISLIGEEEGKKEDIQDILKVPYIYLRFFGFVVLVATLSLISFSYVILPEVSHSCMFWFIVLFFVPSLGQSFKAIRGEMRPIIPLLEKEEFSQKTRRALSLTAQMLLAFGLLIFPSYLPWYLDRGEVGILFASLILLLFQLYIIPFFILVTAFVIFLFLETKPSISYRPLSSLSLFGYKLGLVSLILVFGFFLVFFSSRFFNSRDIPPVNDSYLRLSKIEIPKSENAFYEFMRAHDESRLPADTKVLSDLLKNRDYKAIGVILKQNERVFPIIEKALKLPVFQSPQLQDPSKVNFNTKFSEYTKLRKLAHLCIVKADYLFEKGKEKEAFDWILKGMKIGQMIEESPRPLLVTYLVGVACKEIGLKEIRKLVSKTNLPPEELKFYAEAILDFEPSDEAFIQGVKMEYALAENFLRKIEEASKARSIYEKIKKEEGWDKSFDFLVRHLGEPYYLPNETRLIYVEKLRRLISYAKKLYKDADVSSLELPPPRGFILFRRNLAGKAWIAILMPIYPNTLYRHFTLKFSNRATAILLALKAYKREKGHLPESLSELVPKYLSKIPIDPFDGQPLRYLREGKVIYCVGRILRDLGPPPEGFRKTLLEKMNYAEMPNPAFFIDF